MLKCFLSISDRRLACKCLLSTSRTNCPENSLHLGHLRPTSDSTISVSSRIRSYFSDDVPLLYSSRRCANGCESSVNGDSELRTTRSAPGAIRADPSSAWNAVLQLLQVNSMYFTPSFFSAMTGERNMGVRWPHPTREHGHVSPRRCRSLLALSSDTAFVPPAGVTADEIDWHCLVIRLSRCCRQFDMIVPRVRADIRSRKMAVLTGLTSASICAKNSGLPWVSASQLVLDHKPRNGI